MKAYKVSFKSKVKTRSSTVGFYLPVVFSSLIAAVMLAASLLAASTLAGCFGSDKVPRSRYYGLPIHERAKPSTSEGALSIVLRVEEFDVAPGYDHLRLVYRVSPYEIRHYGYRQWLTKPGRLMADAMRLYLDVSGRFATVTEQPRPLPDYVLSGKVETLEEVDNKKKKQWYARLVITLSLVRVSSGEQVWSKRFDKMKKVKKRRPRYVIAGLTDLYSEVARETLGRITEIVKQSAKSGGAQKL